MLDWQRLGEVVMVAELASHADGAITVALNPPPTQSDSDCGDLAGDMTKASKIVEAEPGISKSKFRGAFGGKVNTADRAIAALVGEYVKIETGSRGAHLHFSIKPFRENQAGGP